MKIHTQCVSFNKAANKPTKAGAEYSVRDI